MSPTGLGVQEDNTTLTGPLPKPPIYVLLVLRVTGFPFYSSLIYLDERIHRQVGQEEETAARRLYEVNQYQLYEERESALRRELEEIQFEEEISLQARPAHPTLGTRRSSCLYC